MDRAASSIVTGKYTLISADTDFPSVALNLVAPKTLATLDKCAAWCTATAGCVLFVYGSGPGCPNCCRLKHGYGDRAAAAGLSAYAPYDLAGTSMDLNGSDVEPSIRKAGLTLDECRALCLGSPKCKLVVYTNVSGVFWCNPKTALPANGVVRPGSTVYLVGEAVQSTGQRRTHGICVCVLT